MSAWFDPQLFGLLEAGYYRRDGEVLRATLKGALCGWRLCFPLKQLGVARARREAIALAERLGVEPSS